MNINTIPYTIRATDNLYLIANRFNTSVKDILIYNPGLNPQNLRIGQVIFIPEILIL